MARVTVSPCPRAPRSRITVTALGLAAGLACLSVVVYGCSREAAGTPFTPPAAGDDGSTGDEPVNLAPAPSLTSEGGSVDDAGAVFTGPLPGPFNDFPAAPILDAPDGGDGGSAPPNSATLFGARRKVPRAVALVSSSRSRAPSTRTTGFVRGSPGFPPAGKTCSSSASTPRIRQTISSSRRARPPTRCRRTSGTPFALTPKTSR